MRKLGGSHNIENVVVNIRPFGPPVPIRKKQQVHCVFGANVNRIVVNQTVLDGAGEVDAPRAVILADVVAHDCAGVTRAFFGVVTAFVADQKKTTVIVVTVIVLDDGIPAIPVGIESFAVALPFCPVGLVILDHRVVGAPSPNRDVVSLGPLIGMA